MPNRRRTKSPGRLGYMSDKNACMFCLCEKPLPVKYDGPCNCKPYVHLRCLTTWFKATPNECPLCRKDYDPVSEEEEEEEPEVPQQIVVLNRRSYFSIDHYDEKTKYLFCLIILLYSATYLDLS